MNLEEIKNELENLDMDQLDLLIKYIKDKKLLNDYTAIFIDAVEAKFNDVFVCPHCHSTQIRKNGHYKNGTQRYLCKDCHATFTSTHGTILANTKLPALVWLKYLIIMDQDEDLRDCAHYAGVSLKCSFYMRHKILNAMSNQMNDVQLEGIVELDEMSVNISYSGNHVKQNCCNKLPRNSYKRGRKGQKHKYDDKITDAVQIAGAVDRSGNIYLKVAKIGTTSLDSETVKKVYGQVLKHATTLCTDGLYVYRELSKEYGLQHYSFPKKSKEKRGIYHINHINYIHSKIKEYMRKHTGISSKYLDEYLSLIAYTIKNKQRNLHDNFVNIYQYPCTFRRAQYIGTPFLIE